MTLVLLIALGVVVAVAGVLIVRFRERVAVFFRESARPMFGDKLVKRPYTASNMTLAGAGFIVFGAVALLLGVLGIFGIPRPYR